MPTDRRAELARKLEQQKILASGIVNGQYTYSGVVGSFGFRMALLFPDLLALLDRPAPAPTPNPAGQPDGTFTVADLMAAQGMYPDKATVEAAGKQLAEGVSRMLNPAPTPDAAALDVNGLIECIQTHEKSINMAMGYCTDRGATTLIAALRSQAAEIERLKAGDEQYLADIHREVDSVRADRDRLRAELAACRAALEQAKQIAWKMQSEQFGGGTAIGNAIQEISERLARPPEAGA